MPKGVTRDPMFSSYGIGDVKVSDSWSLRPLHCSPVSGKKQLLLPVGSMYGIFTYIWLIFMVNAGTYAIHGWYGLYIFAGFLGKHCRFSSRPARRSKRRSATKQSASQIGFWVWFR